MKFSFSCICFGAVLLFTGCTDSAVTDHTSFFAMDTAVSVILPADCSPQAAKEEIMSLSDSLDGYRSESVLTQLAENTSVTDPDLAAIVSESRSLSARFGDAVSLSCGRVTKLWGIATDAPCVPDADALQTALQTVDDSQIRVDGNTVIIAEGTELDLGSVAKGYALDRVSEIWQSEGVPYGICSMRSAVLLYGEKPDGNLFSVQIQSPDDASQPLGTVSVPACFVATAGGYERYFTTENGETYCHILDLTTGYPVRSDLTTVTVFTDNGLKADYLSTLIFIEGTQNIAAHLAAADYDLIAADTDGRLYISEGLQFSEDKS